MSLLPLLLTLAYPTVEGESFSAEQQHKALAATVRIVLPGTQLRGVGQGTGVIVGRREKMVFVLTANHVAVEGRAIQIQTFADASYPKPEETTAAEVTTRWPKEDLALLRAFVQSPPGVARICPESLLPKGDTFAVLAVGCTGGAEPTCLIDRLKGSGQFVKPDGTKAHLWESGHETAVGRSGGPLFDRRGYVVGICSGNGSTKSGRNGYYVHLTVIHKALGDQSLSWLWTDEPKNGK